MRSLGECHDERQDDDPHDVVDHGSAEDRGALTRAQRAELEECLCGDAHARRGENRAYEESLPEERQTEGDRCRGATGHWQHHASEGGPECHLSHPAHFLEVGFEARHEHQQEHADIRQIADERQQDRRPLSASTGVGEHRPAEHVRHRGTEHQTGKDFTKNRRLTDPGGQCARHLCRNDDESEKKKQLQEMGHQDTGKLYVRIADDSGPLSSGF